MAEEFTVTLPVSMLEDLRCSICQGYLSCSPVRLLPNGNCICGSCSPLNTDAPVHRLVTLEGFLSKTSFPCVFKKYGCTEMLPFGGTADHESKCLHKPFACPTTTPATCPWEGSVSQLLHHFQNSHPDFLKEKAEFTLELGKDAQNVFMTTENSFAFIVKYFYTANRRILKYDIRLCANKNDLEVLSKMQISNGADADFNINLKIKECSSYNETFYDMQNAKELNINKLLESLGDPDCTVVSLKLSVVKANSNGNALINISEVNLDLIKTLRCYACHNYLIPPLFHLNGKTICCDCSKKYSNCKFSTDTDLLKRVIEAVYPCRWRECTFISKTNLYKYHMMKCPFRQYYCVYSGCHNTFKFSGAVAHLQAHENQNTAFMPGQIKFKTSFAMFCKPKHILTIKNNRIIVIILKLINAEPPYQHCLQMYRSREDARSITGTVEFEHEHCTLKSTEFNIVSGTPLNVVFKDLPRCFTVTDELTVTVKVIA